MRSLAFSLIMALLSGCASAPSIHDYCVRHKRHYDSYKECYREIAHNREQRRISDAKMYQGLANATYTLNRPDPVAPPPVRCTTAYGVTTCE